MIIMNMQNKLYTIQFFSPPDDWFAVSPQAAITEPQTLGFLRILWNSQKSLNLQKSFNSWMRADSNLWKKQEEQIPPTQPTLIYKLSMTSMVWTISTGQLGLAVWLCSLPAPAQLVISWIWATGKSPWFHRNNWKHQCYQHSSHTKSKTQQLLEGKLSPSQLKPGQPGNNVLNFFRI